MDDASLEFFHEFGAYCYQHHPRDVWMNASTLVSTGIVGPGPRPAAGSVRFPRAAGGLTRAFAGALARRGRVGPAPARPAPVLWLYPFDRRDHEGLFRPFIERLRDAGVDNLVVTTASALDRWRDLEADGHVFATSRDAYASASAYRDARSVLAAVRPAIRDLASRFRLDAASRAELVRFFTDFAVEKALARRILARAAPKAVIGLHFVASRGWHAALDEARRGADRPAVVLVQHGAFATSDGHHDFEGADDVLLWGTLWRRELEGFQPLPFRPVPPGTVVGNPKYDGAAGRGPNGAAAAPEGGGASRWRRVLYLSSHHDGQRTKLKPLTVALEAAKMGRGFELVVKPHPVERPDVIQGLVASGSLRADAVASPDRGVDDLIRTVDAVIGPESTVLFEAIRLGRPVVLLSEQPTGVFEGFVAAADADALHAVVERWPSDERWRQDVLAAHESILTGAFGPPQGAVEAGLARIRTWLAQRADGPAH